MLSDYFLKSSIAGVFAGIFTIKLISIPIPIFYHVMYCTLLAGGFSLILVSPNTFLMISTLLLLPVGWYSQETFGYYGYGLFIFCVSYLAWTRTEMFTHHIKLIIDAGYREKYEKFKHRK